MSDEPELDEAAMREQVEGLLDELAAFLSCDRVAEDTLTYSGLDGLVACMAIDGHPEPDDWLEVVWGEREPAFTDEEERLRLIDAIRLRYAIVCLLLHKDPEAYFAELERDEDGQLDAKAWADGFLRGVEHCGGTQWRVLRAFDGPVLLPILALALDDEQLRRLGVEEDPALLRRETIDKLGDIVRDMYTVSQARRPARSIKVGRNEPCPCGSGRKFKRCCGA